MAPSRTKIAQTSHQFRWKRTQRGERWFEAGGQQCDPLLLSGHLHFQHPLASARQCQLPGGVPGPRGQDQFQPTGITISLFLDPAAAPGALEGGSLSTGTAEGPPGRYPWSGSSLVPADSTPLDSVAERHGDPHVTSFQPGPHHPTPEAPPWPCPSHSPLTQLNDKGT